jgi:hypothetical protein
MSRFTHHLLSRPLLFGILLAALVLRSLVPVGYMPASGESFAMQMCQVGLPAGLAGDEGSSHNGSHAAADSSFCSFGSAPGAGPAPHVLTPWAASPSAQPLLVRPAVSFFLSHRSYDRQARAPPTHS